MKLTINISDNATNGDVVLTMFPEVKTNEFYMTVHATTNVIHDGVKGGISYDFWKDWWNAPYKADKGGQMANKLSQNIIEHARRVYPKSVSHTGQLTNEQFCEIEKECDIDFYKLVSQDTRYTIRYKAEGSDKECGK